MNMKSKLILVFGLILSLIFNMQFVYAGPNKTAPSAPTGLTTSSIGTSSLTLKWNSISGVSGYYVYRATLNDID